MINTINVDIKGIVYQNGNTEIAVVTPQQWAGRMRRKGYKKTIVNVSNLASINIKIKTK